MADLEILGSNNPVVSMALTTTAAVKALPLFRAEYTYTDEQIQSAIESACAEIERVCNRKFSSASYTFVTGGNGRQVLVLPQYPVISVESVTINGAANTEYQLDAEQGMLYLEYGWPRGFRNITVEYTAGYAEVPADLALICARLAVDMLGVIKHDPAMQSEKFTNYQYELKESAGNLVGTYMAELASYRSLNV